MRDYFVEDYNPMLEEYRRYIKEKQDLSNPLNLSRITSETFKTVFWLLESDFKQVSLPEYWDRYVAYCEITDRLVLELTDYSTEEEYYVPDIKIYAKTKKYSEIIYKKTGMHVVDGDLILLWEDGEWLEAGPWQKETKDLFEKIMREADRRKEEKEKLERDIHDSQITKLIREW